MTDDTMRLDVECYDVVTARSGQRVGLGQVRYGGMEDYVVFAATQQSLRRLFNDLHNQPGPEIDYPSVSLDIEHDILAMSDARFSTTNVPGDL